MESATQPNKKVVIVEDNDLNLKLFNDLLSAHGCDTVETKDGREALNLVKLNMPDLVLMDIQLPHVSGIEIIRQIKAEESIKHIPVIAVTAFAMEHDKDKIMEAGCEDYVAKPISIEAFVQVIQKYL